MTTDNQQDTPIIAEGEYDYDEDENQISLVEGADIGTYVMKIMPDMRHQVFDVSTLRLDVKTYYCDMRGTPRAKFLEEFPHDAYKRHRHRLVTSHKTLEELNEAEDDFERCGGERRL
jgi:hypothetical protein